VGINKKSGGYKIMNQRTIIIVGVVVVGLLAAGWMIIPAGSPLSDYVKMGDGSIDATGDIGVFGLAEDGTLIDVGAATALQAAYLGTEAIEDLIFDVSWSITMENIKIDSDLRLTVGVKLHSVELEDTEGTEGNFTDITTVARDIFIGEDVPLNGSISYSLIDDIFAGEEEVLETIDDVFARVVGENLTTDYTFIFHFNVTVDVRGYTELTPIIGDLFGDSQLMWAVASADVDITVTTYEEEPEGGVPASAFNVNIPVDMSNKILTYGVFVIAVVLVIGGYLIKMKPQTLRRRRRKK